MIKFISNARAVEDMKVVVAVTKMEIIPVSIPTMVG
jgi:hypothetical protein